MAMLTERTVYDMSVIGDLQEACAEFLRVMLNHLGMSSQYSTKAPPVDIQRMDDPQMQHGMVFGVTLELPVERKDLKASAQMVADNIREHAKNGGYALRLKIPPAMSSAAVLRDELTGLSVCGAITLRGFELSTLIAIRSN